MGIKFQILGSSSSGNCALLTTDENKILIDAGFSGRKLETLLQQAGESLSSIDAVFLTHEHTDHCKGLNGLSKFPHINVYANEDTAACVQKKLSRPISWQIFETGQTFFSSGMEVTTFSIPHDAYDPVGFVFTIGQGMESYRIAWVTDLGYIPQLVREKIRMVDVLVIEANYDPGLLEQNERRPWSVKQRIKSRHGHLANHETYELLQTSEFSNLKQVYLAHLSSECNSVPLVQEMFSSLSNSSGGCPFSIEVVSPQVVNLSPFNWTGAELLVY